ncbi:MAG: helix-turn-helix transcriptional regulator, partial [Chloroflexi bacterium]|nr:helix-turn-helix transcriptional regulator [Lujinxingiaceae bacterium]MBA4171016.1 helix-turn-helix transcriptional regulator [Chloroflexota bacterium]
MQRPTDESLIITDRRAAALLVDPDERRYFEPFLGRERTVTEAARELGVPPNGMRYRVRRMAKLGLLRIVREQPRAGRPMRVYRSVADRLFVPYVASPAVD